MAGARLTSYNELFGWCGWKGPCELGRISEHSRKTFFRGFRQKTGGRKKRESPFCVELYAGAKAPAS